MKFIEKLKSLAAKENIILSDQEIIAYFSQGLTIEQILALKRLK